MPPKNQQPKPAPKQGKGGKGRRRKPKVPYNPIVVSTRRVVTNNKTNKEGLSKMMEQRVAMGIMFPYEHPTKSFDVFPKKTALRSFRQTYTVYGDMNVKQLPDGVNGDFVVALFGWPGLQFAKGVSFPSTATARWAVATTNVRDAATQSGASSVLWSLRSVQGVDGRMGGSIAPSSGELTTQGRYDFLDENENWPLVRLFSPTAYGSFTGLYQMHGGYPVIGRSGTRNYIYMNVGDCIMIAVNFKCTTASATSANGLAVDAIFEVMKYRSDGPDDRVGRLKAVVYSLSAVIAGGTAIDQNYYLAYNNAEPGWYTVDAVDAYMTGNWADIQLALTSDPSATLGAFTASFRILYNVWVPTAVSQATLLNMWNGAPGSMTTYDSQVAGYTYSGWDMYTTNALVNILQGNPLIGTNTRVTGSSLLLMNTTPVLNRGGHIHCARLNGDAVWAYTQAKIAGSNTYKALKTETGAFTFMHPSERRNQFYQAVNPLDGSSGPTGTGWGSPMVDLEALSEEFTHVIRVEPVVGATVANQFDLILDTALEFAVDSQMFPSSPSPVNHASYHQMLRMIEAQPEVFWENPSHVAQLVSWVRDAINGSVRLAKWAIPRVAPVATALNPALGPVMAALSALAVNSA